MAVTIVAAVARNGVIGVDGALPWRLPGDLRRFKDLTMGHTLVMGRRTYESIGRPLPGRRTVVVTRNPDWSAEGVVVASSVEKALAVAGDSQIFVVGGAEVYAQALEVADVLELTEVEADPDGDTHFPPVRWTEWREVARLPQDGFSFVTYHRTQL